MTARPTWKVLYGFGQVTLTWARFTCGVPARAYSEANAVWNVGRTEWPGSVLGLPSQGTLIGKMYAVL